MNKIHFINRIDMTNIGDRTCSPLNYFSAYFRQFNIRHYDIDFIDWRDVDSGDIAIVGGSGMLDVTASFNRNINRLLKTCRAVVAWSIGFNAHDKSWDNGSGFELIDFDKFAMISIRDYQHPSGMEYLPCLSCLLPYFDEEEDAPAAPSIGIIEHKDHPIVLEDKDAFDRITNAYPAEEVVRFIRKHTVIVTNSYHMVYWTQLLSRTAIVMDKWSTKFDYYQYRPVFLSHEDFDSKTILATYGQEVRNAGFLKASRAMNMAFFDRVKALIEALGIPKDHGDVTAYCLTSPNTWNQNDLRLKLLWQNEMVQKLMRENAELHRAVAKLNDNKMVKLGELLGGK